MRSSPPRRVNSASSSITSRSPLHLMNETSMSTRSAEAISFLSSETICGSCAAPVNRLLWASEVSGRTVSLAVFPRASRGSFSSSRVSSCSARSSTESEEGLSSVSPTIRDTSRLTSATSCGRSRPSSCNLSIVLQTTCATYCDSTPEASAGSTAAVCLHLSGSRSSSLARRRLISCS